ncbi:MAG: DUF58 domain-containing protein [bacterium]|nr:DUF58 domain-containing protein [Candidatus Sumerlaeota bacterium]
MIPREILSKVRQIEIVTNRLVNEVMAGSYHSVFKGRGMEFEEVREYMPGDDVRTIDWNVTARTGAPHVKVYTEERELMVMLMVDLSGSTDFGSGERLKSELAAEICALLAFSAIKNNDRVGLLIFTDRVEKFIPPKKGKNHVLRVIREVLYFSPTGRGTDIPAAIEHVMRVLNRKSVVFLISDFFAENIRRPMSVLNKNHDLIALRMRDPREMELPPMGIVPFEDTETGEVLFIDTFNPEFRRRFRETAERGQYNTEMLFKQLKVDYANIDSTTKSYLDPIVQIFRRRAQRY